jgi:hypothetical protein
MVLVAYVRHKFLSKLVIKKIDCCLLYYNYTVRKNQFFTDFGVSITVFFTEFQFSVIITFFQVFALETQLLL